MPFVRGLLLLLSLLEPVAFLEAEGLDLDDVDRVGTGLSFVLEL